ncbi:uncharacterized protein LOC117498622 isoform X14 [Trematomus bernacchii]|uniref:uncharacterized protein LOC117498622 isoform X14 n=1 Tax=Trematomus bernacchii TaxID=40690 RepID=UPI00146ACA90|nr:uncharacterized protein LOC117498622 isoform X14 [Trematomus bernacchii]
MPRLWLLQWRSWGVAGSGHPGHPVGHTKHPHHHPQIRSPLNSPPPTGVNNGIPSKEEPSKVVNKRKGKLVYQMVVTGTTFGAHDQLTEKVKNEVKDQFDLVQSNSNDYDVTIVFCPIVSRMGPDVESALRDVKGNKPVILVLMHHAYEAKFIPNVQQGANVQLQVNVFFHEMKHGLLHCGENGAVVCEITTFLKEIPIPNAQVLAAAVAELPGGWEWPSWTPRWPHQTPSPPPSNQKPVKQPPPTGVNNGIPSKEPSKVVNKRKGKLVYQMVVTGTTFGAHDQLTEKVKNEVKDQFDLVQSNSNDYDVTIVFCPIVSRMGPDVESALRDVKGNKPVILVLMHHAYEAKFIPNVQQGANVQLQVNVFFHETKHGLLHCGENGAVVCEITKYLKEIPIPNAQVVATSWPHPWPHQTPSPPPSNQKPVKQPPPTGVNNGIPSKEEPSKVVNKRKGKLMYQMVVTGTTFDAHVQLMEKVKKDVKDQFDLVQSYSNDYDVTIVFCPIVSRMGPDVESAMRDVQVSSGNKPVILVLMHHAYEAKFIPNVQQGANVQLQVNVFFHETKHGLLHCGENGAVVCEIIKHLKEIPITNAQVVAAAVAELPGGWESACCPPRWPHQTPSNQKPVKQPPPTGVNNGIPSKEEPSKVVNKWKAKLMYQMVVTGTTFDAHVQLMEKVKKDVKDQFDLVQSYSNDYDVTIVFCPIVSRMGPDVESAMRDVQVSSGNKPVILVLMHHAYEAKFIPNVQQGANVQLQVNVFFHETKHGLLHCGENGAVVCEIIKHLKEIPITNAQVVAAAVAELPGGWESACCPPRWPHQTPSNQKPVKQPPPTGVNNGIPSKEEPSKVVNKWKAKLVYQMVVTGTTFDAHVQLMEKVKKDVKDQFDLVQSNSDDYDVTIVFCPIVYRMGPDVESAMRDVKGDKPVILVLMHHAYEAKFIPNVQQGANVQLQVNVFFHETKHGLLNCGENGAVVCEITKYLKEIPITNAQVVAAAVAELPGSWEWASWTPRWLH